jgi:hypothetical protein
MVIAFVNTPVNEAASLVAQMQKLQDENKDAGLRTYVVFQSGRESKEAIEKLATEKSITIPVAHFLGGENDPAWARYKLNPAAKNTILVTKGKVVTANFVNLDVKEFAKVADAAKKTLGAAE